MIRLRFIALFLAASIALAMPFGTLLRAADAFVYKATNNVPYSYVDIATTGVSVLSGEDDSTADLTLPFEFRFYGTAYSHVCVSTNGVASFGGCLTDDITNLDLTAQSPAGNLPLIAPLWMDLTFSPPGSGSIFYQTVGPVGSRQFIVQWSKAFALNLPNPFDFQVILFEGSNNIHFQYKTVETSGLAVTKGSGATVGIRGVDGHKNGNRSQWSFKVPVLHDNEAIRFDGDGTPPVISPLITGTQGLNGWYTSSVNVHWNVSDPESGIQSQQCSDVTLSSDSAGTTVQCSAVNNVGLTASASTTIKIDKVAPLVVPPSTISITATQAGGATATDSPMLATFLAGGSATDLIDPSPLRLSNQVGVVDVAASTIFPLGSTPVTFRSRDAAGNIGSAIANVTVSLGQPKLTMLISSKGAGSPGNYYVDIRFTNTGTGIARNLTTIQLPLKTLSGSGTVTLVSPATPIISGNLAPGASRDVRIYLNRPSTVTRFSVTENGTVQDATGATSSYSAAQTVIP